MCPGIPRTRHLLLLIKERKKKKKRKNKKKDSDWQPGGGKFMQDFLSLAAFLLARQPPKPWQMPLEGARPSPRSPAASTCIFIYKYKYAHMQIYILMYFKSKAKPRALSPPQNAPWVTVEGNQGAWLPHNSWPWQGHHHRRQQQQQLGTAEPPDCGPVTDITRVTETRFSSWEMAPSSHTHSFFLPSQVSQPWSAEGII